MKVMMKGTKSSWQFSHRTLAIHIASVGKVASRRGKNPASSTLRTPSGMLREAQGLDNDKKWT
jgi:hypothetical protein